MSKSDLVRAHEYKQIFLLLGESRELGADPFVWRTHLLERLDRLLGDSVGCVAAGYRPAPARAVVSTVAIHRGVDCEAKFLEYQRRMGPGADPNMNAFLARFEPPQWTAVRRQIVGDRAHYESHYYCDYLAPMHIDDSLCSFHELPDGFFSAVTLHRRSGEQPWSGRERMLLDILHREMAPDDRTRARAGRRSYRAARPAPARRHWMRHAPGPLREKEIAARMAAQRAHGPSVRESAVPTLPSTQPARTDGALGAPAPASRRSPNVQRHCSTCAAT